MRVLGSKVYLTLPKMPDSNLELDEKTRREVQNEMFAKFDRLTVFAIGEIQYPEGVKNRVKVGDEVFVDTVALRNAIFIDIEGSKKAIVPFSSLQHCWT